MEPRFRKSGKPKIAYVLNEKRFRQLVELIQELTDAESLHYTVRLSDASSATYGSADEVLGVQNSRKRRITSLRIETPYQSEPRIEVEFQTSSYLEPVEYEVSGRSEKNVSHAWTRLAEYFTGLRQWYSLISGGWYSNLGLPIVVGSLLALSLGNWLIALLDVRFVTKDESLSSVELAPTAGAAIAFSLLMNGVLVFGGMYLAVKLRRWLLPSGTFAIGDGLDRHNNLVRTRRVVGGVGLTLVLGAVGYLLYPLLF